MVNESSPIILEISRLWNGDPAPAGLRGSIRLEAVAGGLRITGNHPHQASPVTPPFPPGSRVANLWEYDVVECFIAGDAGYLEVEVAQDGRWIVLSFAGPREWLDVHEDLAPSLSWSQDAQGWSTSIDIPSALLPAGADRVNAYVICGGVHLAHAAVPGARPDFHQPDVFVPVSLPSCA